MQFPDFIWQEAQSFVHHIKVAKYLRQYTDHFNLHPNIHLQHHLKHLTRELNPWKVTIHDIPNNKTITRLFDIIILCPGRHSLPSYPQIDGIKQFSGSIIHSHDYRYREPYIGQMVAIIGGGPSGFDLAIELAAVANKVIFVNRGIYQFENLPHNVQQINGEVEQFTSNSMIVTMKLDDQVKKEFEINSVILATGYLFNLEYLDQKAVGIHLNKDDTLDGLYRHMINIKYPTMAMLGICQKGVLPFPMYHQQVNKYLVQNFSFKYLFTISDTILH